MSLVSVGASLAQSSTATGQDALWLTLRNDVRTSRLFTWPRQPVNPAVISEVGKVIATIPAAAGATIGGMPTLGLTTGQSVAMPTAPTVLTQVLDSMTGTAGTGIQARTGETGATWAKHANFGTGSVALTDANRARSNIATTSLVYASGTPTTANYDVHVDLVWFSSIASQQTAIALGVDTVSSNWYDLRHYITNGTFDILKFTGGSPATFTGGAAVASFSSGTKRLVLRRRLPGDGTARLISYADGVKQSDVIDSSSPFTAVGKAGLRSAVASANTTGVHYDNFLVTEPTKKTVLLALRPSALGMVLASDASTSGTDGWLLYVDSSGTVQFREYGSGGVVARSVASIQPIAAAAHLFALVWDQNDGFTMFVDGTLAGQDTTLTPPRWNGTSPVLRAGGAAIGALSLAGFSGDVGTVAVVDDVPTSLDHRKWATAALQGMVPDPTSLQTVPEVYVDLQRGLDTNPGTDALPYQTPAYAFANVGANGIIYLSGDYTTGSTTFLVSAGDRSRTTWASFMPHPTRGLSLVTAGSNLSVRGSNNFRLVGLQLPNGIINLGSVTNGALGDKFMQVIGCKARGFFGRKGQYTTLAGCEFTGMVNTDKGILFQGNLGQVSGWMGSHYVYIQDTSSHDHDGDGFGSYESMHEMIVRRMYVARTHTVSGDHADGLQIESPIGLDVNGLLMDQCNGSGGALFLAQTLLIDNIPKANINLRNVGCFRTNTNGIVIGAGQRVFLSHITATGTGAFGDLKIAGVSDAVFVNSIVQRLHVTGTNVFAYRQNNLIESGFSGTAILGSETTGTPTYAADGKRLSTASSLGKGAGSQTYGAHTMPGFDIDGFARAFPADLGFNVAV